MSRRRILVEPLDVDRCVGEVSRDGAGAIVTFVGVVRDVADGRPVKRLEYHAYTAMAEAELDRVLHELAQQRPEVRVSAEHRVGTLELGDAAVVCAVSAPHRGEAFDACRVLIDTIKERVPIWKREHGDEGPYWVGWR